MSPPLTDPIQYDQISFSWFMECTLAGIGQVFFSPELTSSIIILVGLIVGSPIAGILALFGSAVGNTVAILSHASTSAAEAGIYGLSAVLCAIGLGGFFFVFSKWSLFLAFMGSVFCVPATAVFTGLLVRPMGPSMTLPFCAVATFFYLGAKHLPRPVLVPRDVLVSPERHLCIVEKNDKQVCNET
jgi:urea transporter